MRFQSLTTLLRTLAHGADPRRSLVVRLIWLVIALTASFAIAASLWVGRVAREIVVQQHVRRLVLETDQLGSDLGQAIDARVMAVRGLDTSQGAAAAFAYLTSTYPRLGWTVAADADGRVVNGDGMAKGIDVRGTDWFTAGRNRPWIGVGPTDGTAQEFGDLALPLKDAQGATTGVIVAHLNWHWAAHDLQRLSASLDPRGSAQTLVLDEHGSIRVGPASLTGKPWNGVVIPDAPRVDATPASEPLPKSAPRFERLPDGHTVLVARAPILLDPAREASLGWEVQLSEPKEQVFQRADALALRILWISICLGAVTAALGAAGAGRLTHRLQRLTRSAAAVGRNEFSRIEVPSGHDEVAQLAGVLSKVLDDLRIERSELLSLSTELERRVGIRTREVERLAEEARYAAVVRERLKIARDLHDTLAHSMMAMLSEIRLLRKLQTHDPAALAEELARAEEVAHDGLNEARTAITQMRVNAVRDTGLGAALAQMLDRFRDRTGIAAKFSADPVAASVGDERAETLFRMAEEALRNIERHSSAGNVGVALDTIDDTHVRLRIEDDGVGFDPERTRPGHYGLVGLREQAQLIGADLLIDSMPGRGTVLSAVLRIVPELL